MAIGILIEIPGGTQKHYDTVMQHLKLGGKPAPGGLYHVAGPMDGGWRVVDVWESQKDFETFFQTKLQNALKNAGVPAFQPKFFPVHNIIKAA